MKEVSAFSQAGGYSSKMGKELNNLKGGKKSKGSGKRSSGRSMADELGSIRAKSY